MKKERFGKLNNYDGTSCTSLTNVVGPFVCEEGRCGVRWYNPYTLLIKNDEGKDNVSDHKYTGLFLFYSSSIGGKGNMNVHVHGKQTLRKVIVGAPRRGLRSRAETKT